MNTLGYMFYTKTSKLDIYPSLCPGTWTLENQTWRPPPTLSFPLWAPCNPPVGKANPVIHLTFTGKELELEGSTYSK